jgi:TPP-dependent pyruvate/acetoin dehydrogenase alpha subunit
MATCPDHRKHGVGCGCDCPETDVAAKSMANAVHLVVQRVAAVALGWRALVVLCRFMSVGQRGASGKL